MSYLKPLALIFLVALTACGNSGSNPSNVASLAGNWQMTLQNATSSETQSGFLLDTANTLSGGFLLSGQTNSGETSCSGVGSAVGQATGDNIQLTVNPAGQTVTLTGTSASNPTSMSGTYSILAAGCGQTEIGTWSANLVDTLTGNFQATFSLDGSSTVFHFSGSVTQGPNLGQSSATLSGTMTSSDSPCFTSATIGGVVSGTTVVFNLVGSDGSELGKYSGTMTTDATSISGTYRFSNASDPTVLGPCQGYGGDATVTVQPSSTTNSTTN